MIWQICSESTFHPFDDDLARLKREVVIRRLEFEALTAARSLDHPAVRPPVTNPRVLKSFVWRVSIIGASAYLLRKYELSRGEFWPMLGGSTIRAVEAICAGPGPRQVWSELAHD
jgi:hypothetical protein